MKALPRLRFGLPGFSEDPRPTSGEHMTVQARILAYAQAIGWTYVRQGNTGSPTRQRGGRKGDCRVVRAKLKGRSHTDHRATHDLQD
jgi:hypothetical protein